MSNVHIERIKNFQNKMAEYKLDYYILTNSDFHQSEYVCEHFRTIEYISGFTGSNGTILVTLDKVYLWTDGRYDVQVKEELSGLDIIIYITSVKNTPSLLEFMHDNISSNSTIGFDGRIINAYLGNILKEISTKKNSEVTYDIDLIDEIWEDRNEIKFNKITILNKDLSGVTYEDKLNLVREKMVQEKADVLLISSLDDIMWLFNIRGCDIKYNLVALSHCLISKEEAILFVNENVQDKEFVEYCKNNHIDYINYECFHDYISEFFNKNKLKRCIIDYNKVSYATYKKLENEACIKDVASPTLLMKSKKNNVEIENLKKVYLIDSILITKFIYWVKTTDFDINKMTEYDIQEYLLKMRKEIAEFIDLSFETISAYGENAAKMHYSADKSNSLQVSNKGMLLVDTGAHYYGGTTDMTRTMVLGDVDEDVKKMYTATVAGMLRLQNAVFVKGCTGRNLDILARGPLWKLHSDYKCGTGHGVGYMLGVHEGPQAIRYQYNKSLTEFALDEGVVISNEPGVYIEGQYGIRIENIMRCVNDGSVGGDDYMRFESLTYVPIDLEAINKKYMTSEDIDNLNSYHSKVREIIRPHLNEEEKLWFDKEVYNI